MDPTVNACDDFYRFAVGKWRETHPLPAQYSRFGRFEELAERNRETFIRSWKKTLERRRPRRAEARSKKSATSTLPA